MFVASRGETARPTSSNRISSTTNESNCDQSDRSKILFFINCRYYITWAAYLGVFVHHHHSIVNGARKREGTVLTRTGIVTNRTQNLGGCLSDCAIFAVAF